MAAAFRAAAIHQAKRVGFTQQALDLAAKETTLSPAIASIMTPAELAIETCVSLNSLTLEYLAGSKLSELPVSWINAEHQPSILSNNLTTALQLRYALLLPYKEHWAETRANLLVDFGNLGKNSNLLAKFIDELMYSCGDKSVDFQFHVKRALLLKIYLASDLVFIQDDSEEIQETRRFIERQIAMYNFS